MVHEKPIQIGGGGGGKEGAGGPWTLCRFKGGLARKRGVVFLRRVDTPMHIMVLPLELTRVSNQS